MGIEAAPVIVDLDDFCDEYAPLDLLRQIKVQIPQFKVTLFTIPGRIRRRLFETVLNLNWVDLAPHGWMHRTNWECAIWSRQDMIHCLDRCEAMGFRTRGFKAPGWQISDPCYYALRDRGYWIADQERNRNRWPVGLRVFVHRSNRLHGHTGGPNRNALSLLMPHILKHRDREFGFVRDAVV